MNIDKVMKEEFKEGLGLFYRWSDAITAHLKNGKRKGRGPDYKCKAFK